jgi:hypothetical protein
MYLISKYITSHGSLNGLKIEFVNPSGTRQSPFSLHFTSERSLSIFQIIKKILSLFMKELKRPSVVTYLISFI